MSTSQNTVSSTHIDPLGRYIHCQWILPGKINSLAVSTVSEIYFEVNLLTII